MVNLSLRDVLLLLFSMNLAVGHDRVTRGDLPWSRFRVNYLANHWAYRDNFK
jgi:hypothetical protein